MNGEFARKLKEKREALYLTIEEVVEKTKLAPSVVKALEEAQWEKISPIYLRGFLKIYSSFLGIVFDETILKPPQPPPGEPPQQEPYKTHKEPSKASPFLSMFEKFPPWGAKAVVFIICGIIALLIVKSCVGERESIPQPRQPKEEIVHPVKPPVFPPKKVNQKEDLEVTLTVKKDCFVKVRVEGNVVFEGVFKKGVVETWKGKNEIEFKISDGTAVDIEVNGKLLPSLTKMRKPIKSLKITPAGISVTK